MLCTIPLIDIVPDSGLETFYYFLITTYYYLCISQTIYAALAFPEQIKKSPGLKLKINPDDEDIPNRKHIQRTPMIAAGKTNHIWTMGEPLTFSHFKTSVN